MNKLVSTVGGFGERQRLGTDVILLGTVSFIRSTMSVLIMVAERTTVASHPVT